MKFLVSSSALLKQLQVLQGALTTSNTLPILDNFLFDVNEKVLTVTASDLETTITVRMPIESKDTGSIAIPARLLLDTLKAFPEQPLTFTIDPKTAKDLDDALHCRRLPNGVARLLTHRQF